MLPSGVKRQNVCFSRRVDLSDNMCAFSGLGMNGPWVLCWGYGRTTQPCRMSQEGLKSVSQTCGRSSGELA